MNELSTLQSVPNIEITIAGEEVGRSYTDDDIYFNIKKDKNEVTFWLNTSEALELANNIIEQVNFTKTTQQKIMYNLIELLKAQQLCIKGGISEVKFIKKEDSNETGTCIYDIEFVSDSYNEQNIIIENHKIHFGTNIDLIMDKIKSYIGGNHQYTHDIKITPVNFSFSDSAVKNETSSAGNNK